MTSRLNSFPKWRKVQMSLLALVFASNFVFTWVLPIAYVCACTCACIAGENQTSASGLVVGQER